MPCDCPDDQDRSTRPAKRLRLPGLLRRPGGELLSPRGTRHPGRGNGPRAAHGPPGRLAGIPRPPARHPRLPAGRLSPLPGLAALHAANVTGPSRGRSALHRRHLRQPGKQSNSALKLRRTSARNAQRAGPSLDPLGLAAGPPDVRHRGPLVHLARLAIYFLQYPRVQPPLLERPKTEAVRRSAGHASGEYTG